MSYKNYITEIPNFPIDGVNFKDLSPLLQTNRHLGHSWTWERESESPDYWIGVDSRGYIRIRLGISVVVLYARKEGKTPGDKVSVSYDLEYEDWH